jgi:eukaryotic-like serine/threonine-protein kinase
MALASGMKLGPYEIVAPVGAGGMGEVYRAHDTRLGRDVAIKVLPQQFSTDPDLKQRFEREARAISSLSHPHICPLYDVGSQDGIEYLVMEYLDGQTLADRLLRGPLPMPELLKIGIEVADALDKAHRQGIVHRDLKPGNVMLTNSGAKLMDFGLAKTGANAMGVAVGSSGVPLTPSSPTSPVAGLSAKVSPLTQKGMIVGTFQYMAPEVLQGEEADSRSDIFSFGCVLYEMATGKRAFEGKTQISVLAAILEKDPEPVTSAQPMTPPALDMVIQSCLAKDPERRLQTAHDVKLQLEWIAGAGSRAGIPAPLVARRRTSQKLGWAVAIVATAAALALGVGFALRAPVPAHALRASLLAPEQHSFDPLSLALSPDGSKLAFVATSAGSASQLWVRPLDSTAAQPLAGTEEATFPFWSPDSRTVGFFAQGKLKIIDASGGAVQSLADAPEPRGGAWGADGTILFTPNTTSPLLRIPAAGGTPSQAIGEAKREKGATASLSQRWPAFLPDGRHFVFFQFAPDSRGGARANIHLAALGSSQDTTLVGSDYGCQYAIGNLVYVRGGNLMAQSFDEKKLKLIGNPVPIAEQVRGDERGAAAFTLSRDGKLVFAGGQPTALDLAWYDRSGNKSAIIDSGTFQDAHISPDGKKVSAARVDAGGHLEIYIYDLSRGTKSQFSFSQSRDDDPVWSPDGSTIVFDSGRSGKIDLYTRPANGSRQEELLYHDDLDKYPSSWSIDGKYVAYETLQNGHVSIWIMPMGGDHKPYAFLQEQYSTRYPVFSPDAKWVAYTSFETGHGQVYVVGFPKAGGKFLVGDGVAAVWVRNGKELLYLDDHSRITSVEVTAHGDSLELGRPQILFATQPLGAGVFDASNDGKRLLLMQAPVQNSSNLTLVVNWTAGARK